MGWLGGVGGNIDKQTNKQKFKVMILQGLSVFSLGFNQLQVLS